MISYRDTVDGISADQLVGFFEGWPKHPSPQQHLRLLRNSDVVILAWEEETHRVVGFITAVSDGVLSAYIPLLEVLRSHRGQGIGAELVRQMLKKLANLYMVDLTCDESVQPFYERLGFQRYTAMIRRRFDRQSGSGK